MKYLSVALAGVIFLACNQPSNKNQQASSAGNDTALSKNFNAFLDDYYEQNLKLFPLNATQIGDERYDDLLYADFTDGYRAKVKNFDGEYLDKLSKYNRDQLSENNQLSYDILKYTLTMDSAGMKFHDNYFPFDQFNGIPLVMGEFGTGSGDQPFKTVKNYENWLSRIYAFDVWADSAIVYLQKGIATGEVLPKTLVVKMIPELTSLVSADPKKSLFYGPVEKWPSTFPDSTKQRLTSEYQDAILHHINPSYQKLADFLKNEYLPKARTTDGLYALPDGKAMYAYDVKYWTTTDLSPDSIYHLGLQQVAMLRNEMEKVKDSVGFKGDLPAFFKYLRTDPKFTPFKTDSDVIRAYRAILAKVQPQMPQYFHHFPKTPFVIRETEKFRAASASAEYNQGSADGSRPGVFYVPIVDATKFNVTDGMTSTFLHEAIPGHHYQLSLQQENTSLPKFRRFAWYGAYGEGWAHYTETLGYQLGVYNDPYQHFGALSDQMLRAIRLVVDVGIHAGKLNREQAIQYMTDNESISDHDATEEIERYMAFPGQACSYKIGALTIRALRDKTQRELDDQYNIADFHDEILKDGCMPLSVLEMKIDHWIQSKKGNKSS